MSNPSLPPEMLDHIVDFLYDDIEPLSECCLVSKSWVPRARKHLFAKVQFYSLDDIKAWRETFPDPSNSPAHYTRILVVNCFRRATEQDPTEGGCIPAFSRVVQLDLDDNLPSEISLAPFSRFSPTLRTLNVASCILPRSQIFDLICSLPLLEDLLLFGDDPVTDDDEQDGPHATVSSPVSPKLTGTLELFLFQGMARTLRRFLDLPHGVHFQTIKLSWYKEGDRRYMAELVAACSNTLEDFVVTCELKGTVYSIFPLGSATYSSFGLQEGPQLARLISRQRQNSGI